MATQAPPTEATNADLVRWAFEALFDKRDIDALKQFWTSSSVERFPDRTCQGTEEIAAYFREVLDAVPDLRMEIVALAEQGDDVFVQWHMTGTHKGTLLGIDATGKSLAIDGIDHFVVRDGKLVSNFVVVDQMQYARALGMMPPDGSGPDRALKAAFNTRTKVAAKIAERRNR